MTNTKPYFVARTKPNREKWAAENILRQGRTPYLPMIGSISIRGGRTIAVAKPLFSSYVFVEDSNGQWKYLLGTFGLIGVVLVGEKPALISSVEIEKLRKRENEAGLVVLPKARFRVGASLRVTGGSMVNKCGIYEGQSDKDRQQVLIDYMGRKTRFFIPDDELELA